MLRTEWAKHHAEGLAKLTEQWCWKAIAHGVGNRVWRSHAITSDFKITYQFKILGPGETPPGAGTVFGPFSVED